MVSVFANRGFALLWTAALVSRVGNWILIAALPYYLYEQTGSALAPAALLASYAIPAVVFAPLAGFVADRFDRRQILVVANGLQAVTVTTLVLVDREHLLWAYVITFTDASLAQFFIAAERSMLPDVVAGDQILGANAWGIVNDGLSRTAGPLLGGLLLLSFDMSAVAIADAGSFFISACLIALIRIPRRRVEAGVERRPRGYMRRARESVESVGPRLRRVRTAGLVAPSLLIAGPVLVAEGLMRVLLVPFVHEAVRAGPALVGAALGARGLVGVVAAGVVGYWGTRVRPAVVIAVVLPCAAIAALAQASIPTALVVLVSSGLLGACSSLWTIAQQTLLQRSSPADIRGRIQGIYASVGGGSVLVATFVVATLEERVGVIALLQVAAALFLAGGLVAIGSWGRRLLGWRIARGSAERPRV